MANKSEQKYYKAVKEFVDFCEILEHLNYNFIGYFANLAFKHFRSSSYFMITIYSEDIPTLKAKVVEKGYCYNDNEFFGDYVLVKYYESVEKINDRIKIDSSIENFSCVIYFPTYEKHKDFMLKHNSVYSKEDIEMIESESPRVNSKGVSFENSLYLFLNYLIMCRNDHNHSKGALSCKLCNREML